LSVQVPPELEECGLSKVTSASQGGQLAGASYQAVLRDQPELFGRIASTPTAWRVIERAAKDPDGLARLRAARAHARARAWAAGGLPDVELVGLAVAQLPAAATGEQPVLVRSDSAEHP
jgi:hypothetical protein